MVSLLSHQLLLQNLDHVLLEEFLKQPEGQEKVTPVTSDPSRAPAGFLRYISINNLAIILDLLLDSYRWVELREASSFRAETDHVTSTCAGPPGTSTPARV